MLPCILSNSSPKTQFFCEPTHQNSHYKSVFLGFLFWRWGLLLFYFDLPNHQKFWLWECSRRTFPLLFFFWAARKELFFQIKYRTTPISAWTFLNCGLAELWPKEDQTFVHMQMKSSHSKNMILRFLFWKQFFFHCIWTVFLFLFLKNCEQINEEIPC